MGSTNDQAKELARAGAPAWTVVLADSQTAGRGRQGSAWQSPQGGLYLSVLLRPEATVAVHAGLLPLGAGLAAAQALDEWGMGVELKWPNDLWKDGRKLGGILVEAATSGGRLESVIVGLGINVRADPRVPFDNAQSGPTWMDRERGAADSTAPEIDPVAVGAAVLARLALCYDGLAREGTPALLAAWRVRAVPWWGRTIEARAGETVITGKLRGLAEDGGLRLELPDGRETVLHSGEVREVRATGV